ARCTVVTPNVPEARALVSARDASGREAAALDATELALGVHALGPRAVVVTGGHREHATDVFFDGERVVELPGERYADGGAQGSGCRPSSGRAARLAGGDEPLEAARHARRRAADAVRDGLGEVGHGAGPVDVIGITDKGCHSTLDELA